MGLLDYYRQFAGMSEQEQSEEYKRRSSERRAQDLAIIDTLDLSGVHWHEFPHPDVVAAITYAARRALNRPPDPHAVELRQEIARRSGVEPERVVAGHGAAQLLQSALRTLAGEGDEIVMPWPTYRFLPAMARTAGARPVPVLGPLDPERLLAAVTPHTRAVVVGNPNDPTGEALSREGLHELAHGLPEQAWLVVDEALVDFLPDDRRSDALDLTDEHPRTLVVRTLSKAYGLAGLRCGWAIGPADAAEELTGVAPAGALATPVQAGALEALVDCGPLVQRRRELVAGERARLLDELADTRYDVAPSAANALWISLPGTGGEKLAARLDAASVRVAGGAAWNDLDHVRAQIQSPGATDRLLAALAAALESA
jgi:histidinol-phosphate aminotransferase